MGIFDRLGTVINSYLNDFGEETNRKFKQSRSGSGDPDLDAAFDELNEFLNKDKQFERKQNPNQNASQNQNRNQYSWRDADTEQNTRAGGNSGGASRGTKMPPEELRADFETLGVPFGADEETCKAAYKNLLKIHHPDKHAGHAGNLKKATEKTAKINAAWDRIEKYRQSFK